MEIFIDTGNLDDIKKYAAYGFIDGCTTNPALLAKEGNTDVKEAVLKICEVMDGPVSVEVISRDSETMFKEAVEISKIHYNVIVKVPATSEGFKCLKLIRDYNKERDELIEKEPEGSDFTNIPPEIRTNFTLVYTSSQALLAAKLGATYVSPFTARLDVGSVDGAGLQLIEEIRRIYNNYNFKTKILAASMRTSSFVRAVALAGADVATVPPASMDDMINNELSENALSGFLAGWEKVYPGKTMLDVLKKE